MTPTRHPWIDGRGRLLGWRPIHSPALSAIPGAPSIASRPTAETPRLERVSNAIEATRRTIRHRRWLSEASALLPGILREHVGPAAVTRPARRAIGRSGTVTFVVPDGTGDGLIVKLSRVPAGVASLHRSASAQRTLRDLDGLGAVREAIPEVVGDGDLGPWAYLVERRLAGHPLVEVGPGDPRSATLLGAALDAIDRLHQATLRPVDPALVAPAWVDARLDGVRELITTGSVRMTDPDTAMGRLDAVGDAVRAALDGSRGVAWIHGDLWAANVVVADDGSIRGFVDWDSAGDRESPAHDVLHLLLYARKLRERRALGDVLVDVLRDGWGPAERALLDPREPWIADGRTALVCYWLRLVEANLRRQPGLRQSPVWLDHHVARVVACL